MLNGLSITNLLKSQAMSRLVPYVHEVLADLETPLSAFWKLSQGHENCFLLESVTGGEQLARYSVLGIAPEKVIRSKGRDYWITTSEGTVYAEFKAGEDVLSLLKVETEQLHADPVPGLPIFVGGAVGFLAYDYVRFLEKLPDTCLDDLQLDDACFAIVSTTVVFDHAKNLIKVVSLATGDEAGKAAADAKIQAILTTLKGPLPALPNKSYPQPEFTSNFTQEGFEGAVAKAKEYLGAGDCQQVVPSQRISCECQAHPLTVYRALRSVNPSPYMFLLQFGGTVLVGASPELMVSLHGQVARVRPIAGTRWRGATVEEDDALAADLLQDEKERAEHVMLIDLGRNDLGRVCDFGSVKVGDLMVIERYSHVMHIVSDVTGTLAAGKDAFDLVRASFPAGTVSGSPKVRAMQIIDELEPTRRGSYAGAVGFFSGTGDMDTCIAIRTILLKDGRAHIQAGAGIVYDSDPTSEYTETKNKARAAMRALEMAHQGLD